MRRSLSRIKAIAGVSRIRRIGKLLATGPIEAVRAIRRVTKVRGALAPDMFNRTARQKEAYERREDADFERHTAHQADYAHLLGDTRHDVAIARAGKPDDELP